ncbi:MAG: hypothetical protein NC822_06025 [Candidatus Omnitrophica bacterium]|nr:hypothetical protein [Candidatus Omnitrophota bacterium]MCM8826902.1 hypothetical protein [Candidatus Omnitrophota bacterium]
MKRYILLCIINIFILSTLGICAERFDIYTDKNSPNNRFIPSGWMGDYGDLKFNDQSTEGPYSGSTCISITYTAKRTQGQGWAGIYWQSSSNNWGDKQTGFDLTGFNKLSFMAKGKNGGEVITSVKVGGIQRNSSGDMVAFPDSVNVEYGPIRLSKDWQLYEINLVGKDLSYVNGGFCIVFNADQAKAEEVIYLDDIYFSYDPNLKEPVKKTNFPFYVYADASSLDNHFIPSGWMPATSARDLKLNVNCKENPFSGDSCMKIEYKNNSGTRWAGIYWQNPANNWGTVPDAGFDLRGATKLTFWARGEKGGEIINEFKMGGISSGEYIDSDSASIGPVKLNKEWTKYEIDLKGRDLSYVIGGFCWATNIDVNNPEGIVFYLDEIRYEKD